MVIYFQETVILLFNGISCALLAAAASAKARSYGSHLTGAILLGCLCGLSCPLMREVVLNGNVGGMAVLSQYPDEALIGAVGGTFAIILGRRLPVIFLLDCLGLSFAASLGTLLCGRVFGIVGGVVLGAISAILPGFISDAALGNTAALVERDWYVTAAILGALLAICLYMIPYFFENFSFMEDRLLETAILSGTIFSFCLQFWQRKKEF